jgi:uncharacterized membrane protein YhaH (DUF805 family)
MNFVQAIQSGIGKYVQFGGRASRSEYWYWTLFSLLLSIAASIVDGLFGTDIVSLIVGVALFLPGLAMSARRLHDIDRTFWWVLITFTIVGVLVLIYWACLPGTVGPNRFGSDPL